MEMLLELLGKRDEDKIIEYITSNPGCLDEKDKSGASGYLQILYHRLPKVASKAKELKSDFSFDEAVAAGILDQVKESIEANEVLVAQFCEDGFTPIGLATFFGQKEVAQYLFDAGADPSINANNAMKVSAIHAAAATGNFELMELYVSNGYDVNIPQMNNITPLQSAAYRGDLEMVKLLARHGADPKIESVDGIDAFGYAKEGGHEEVLFYLKSIKKEKGQ